MDAKLQLVLDLFQESIFIYPIGYIQRGGAWPDTTDKIFYHPLFSPYTGEVQLSGVA